MSIVSKIRSSFDNMSLQVRASLAFMIVNFMQKGISFITTPIFTRLLSTDEYGVITIYSSWMDVLSIFATLGLYYDAYCKGILEFKHDRNNFTFSLLMLSNAVTLCVCGGIWIINKNVIRFLNVPDLLILFMFLTFLIEPALEFWKVKQRFDYKYIAVCIFMVVIMLCSPIMSIAGIFLFENEKVVARIVGAQLATLFISLCCYISIVWNANGKLQFKYWKYALAYNLPMLPYHLSTYVLSSSDRLMIAYFWGEGKAGIYGIAYTMAAITNIIWGSVNYSLIPTIYKRCDENRRDTLAGIVTPLLGVFAAVCVCIMAFSPEIIWLLAPSSYGDGMYVVPVVIAGIFFSSHFTIYSNILSYEKKTKSIMWIGIAAAVTNIVLNLIFIPVLGYRAAGYTTLASYLFQLLCGEILVKRYVKEPIYDKKKLHVIGAIVITISILMPSLYSFSWLRYGIVIILLLILWKKKDTYLKLLGF